MTPTSTAPARIVALGDSLTVGIEDVWSNRVLRAWPYLFADFVSGGGMPLQAVNHARSGATATVVRSEQLPRADLTGAVALGVWAGANDIVRREFDPERTLGALADMLAYASAHAVTPLTMELPPASRVFPLPARLTSRWDARCRVLNAEVARLSAEHDGIHLPWHDEAGLIGVDGVHLSQRGQWWYARGYAQRFCARAGLVFLDRPAPPTSVTRWRRWRWYATSGPRWYARKRWQARHE